MKPNFVKIIFAVIYCLLIIFFFRKEAKFFIAPDPEIKKCVHEEFDDGKFTGFASIKLDGLTTGEKGLYIKGESAGRVVYTFKKDPDDVLTIYVRSYGDGAIPGINSNWLISYDEKNFRLLSENIRRFDKRDFLIDLTGESRHKEKVSLQVNTYNENKHPCLTLNWLEIKIINPSTIQGSTYQYPEPWLMTLFLFLLITPILCIFYKLRSLIFICLIFLVGFYLRYQNLTEMTFTALETDPVKHMQYAKQMNLFTSDGFYSGKFGHRGPFFPFISKLFHELLGYSQSHQRFVSFFLSLGVIFLAYILAKELLGNEVGLIVCAITALSPSLIFESGRGNRLELITILILLICYFGAAKEKLKGLSLVLSLGVLGGLLGLTFFYSLLGTFIFVSMSFLTLEKNWKKALAMSLLAAIVICVMVFPDQYNNAKHYGRSPSQSYAVTMAELEASGEQRLPFDSAIRIKYDPDKQNNFSFFDYIFKMHSLPVVVLYICEGLTKALLWQGLDADRATLIGLKVSDSIPEFFKILFFPTIILLFNLFCTVWIIRSLWGKKYRSLSLAIIFYLFPAAWSLSWRIFEFHRYIMHVYPLFLCLGMVGFVRIWLKIKRSKQKDLAPSGVMEA